MKPFRIQLSRAKGWRMPENTVKVDRSTRWGNPMRAVGSYTAEHAVRDFRRWVGLKGRSFTFGGSKTPPTVAEIRRELRGKNLACWCEPGSPCHADVLLEIANR